MKDLNIPEVGEYIRNIGTLIAIEDIQPPPPPITRHYIFEESEARCELRLGDEVIKNLGTLNDFYGLGTCIEAAIKDAQQYAEERNITKGSDLEVVVIEVKSQYRAKPTWLENIYAKGYTEFEQLMTGSAKGLPAPTEKVVWSTKKGA